MRRGVCVKCQATTVRAARNGVVIGEHEPVYLRPHRDPQQRGMFRPQPTDGLWTFVCTTCGHLEFELLDPAAIEFVAANWIEVPPSHAP